MRITYRDSDVRDYWTARWSEITADAPMENDQVYPLKHAKLVVKDRQERILEAGCGAGRILRYYHDHGYDIVGIDYIEGAIKKLKEVDPALEVETGDITQLRFEDGEFGFVLAFGLYHNLEHGLDKAIAETWRVMKQGGKLCASFRADNIQTRMVDMLHASRSKGTERKKFHKMNMTRGEIIQRFEGAGFHVDAVYPVENMPLLYKFAFFRSFKHRKFDENMARKEGYLLSWYGQLLQNFLMRLFPNQFCNLYVAIMSKGEQACKK